MATGTSSSARERVASLSRLMRDKTRRAYALADELRRLGAQLEDAVDELVSELDTDTEEDTGNGSNRLAAA